MYALSPLPLSCSASRSAVTRSTSRRRKVTSRSFASSECVLCARADLALRTASAFSPPGLSSRVSFEIRDAKRSLSGGWTTVRSGPRSSSRSRGKRRPRCAPAERPRYPTAARDSVRTRAVRTAAAGGTTRVDVGFQKRPLMNNRLWQSLLRGFHASSTCASVCGRFFVKVFCAKAAALPSARHTPAATMAEQGKQDIVRKAHPHLPRCAARHLRELHEVHRGRYETSRKGHEKPHPSPNPRARFPFGTREPIVGRVSESRFSIRHPLGFKRALRRSRLPVHHRSRAKTPLVTPQPPARPRSSSGSASSASCSWFLSCTKG